MNRVQLLILALVGFSVCGNAQNYIPYYNLVNEAEYAVYNQDYKSAVSDFEAAFKIEKPHAKDLYLLAYSLKSLFHQSAAHVKELGI